MQIIGILLIIVVILLYFLWLWFTKKQEGVMAQVQGNMQVFRIIVKGVYAPNVIRARVGKPVRIIFKREESNECSRFVLFPDFKIRKELQEGEEVPIEFIPSKKGEFLFSCDMSMYQGRLIVE